MIGRKLPTGSDFPKVGPLPAAVDVELIIHAEGSSKSTPDLGKTRATCDTVSELKGEIAKGAQAASGKR